MTISTFEREVLDALNQTSGMAYPEQWLIESVGGGRSSSGTIVNAATSLGLPAVWNSVQRIGGHIGALPLQARRSLGEDGGSENLPRHPAAKLLQVSPNTLQTPHVFKETMMVHALLNGNGRAWINRNQLGQPIEFIILFPWDTHTVMTDGEKWHITYVDNGYYNGRIPISDNRPGTNNGTYYRIPDSDVLHIPGLSSNGLWGYSVVQILKDIIGLDQAGIESAGANFNNNGRPGLIIEAPKGELREVKDAQEWADNFDKMHKGIDNAGRTALLREGMKATTLPMSASDAEFLSSRKFSREDIALIFGTELVMGDAAGVYKNLTERMTGYIQNCLGKWFEKWEQECSRKLLSQNEISTGAFFFQFDAMSLLRGDTNSLADYTGKLRTQGALSANEVRELNGFNPVAGLDEYGNPNVGQGGPSDEPAAPADEPAPADSQEANATRRHFEILIDAERERVTKEAAPEANKNYLAWLDEYYPKQQQRLSKACRALRVDPVLAERHCESSREQLVELSGLVGADGLQAAVADCVQTWNTRAGEFTNV